MRRFLAVLSTAALLTTGCSALDESTDSDEITVAAGFYPLAYVAERVAEGTATEVLLLTQPGGEAHDLELDVQTTAAVSRADLVIHLDGFQPAVDEAVEQNSGGETIDAAVAVDLLGAKETEEEHAEHADEDEHADEEGTDHAGEDEHADEEGTDHADEDEHDHGDEDPHFWHDPLRMADLGDAVAEKLAEIDPDNASAYEDNAASLRGDLETLDGEFTAGLTGCERDTVVVSHDAFGYLEKYDIHLEPIAGLSPDTEPSPAHRAQLQQLIRTEGITTVFAERLGSYKNSESLAGDLDLGLGVLDPIEGLTDETADKDYLSLMEENLDALRTANGCQ